MLKQLKANVRERLGEDIYAAVITVPADFAAPQIEATNKAATLAGFETSALLQEPVAAAVAYGFHQQGGADRARWLVYDLGGGTFDAALIRKQDGAIRVENHGGDKNLGSGNLDESLVRNLLAPALAKQGKFSKITEGTPIWAHLIIAAEEAKIRLSRVQSTKIRIPDLKDESGNSVDFEFELQRSELERLAEPLIVKTINKCKDVLAEKRLGPADVEKMILVGGPTLMPYLRDRLASELGVPLEFRVDPFTVVARGAAIFAGTQPLRPVEVERGEYRIDLDYKAIGPDVDPVLGGQVVANGPEDLSRFTIEFVNRDARPPWRSGHITLSQDGRFLTSLLAENNKRNTFEIILTTAQGVKQATVPAEFPYTCLPGVGIDAQPLIHDIGIGLIDNTIMPFFKKGTELPARFRAKLRTSTSVKRGSSDSIYFPLVEGEAAKADRNETVGSLEIGAASFKRDLPAGSELEVTIVVNESRLYETKVFIPLLDEEFAPELIKPQAASSPQELVKSVEAAKKRHRELREKARLSGEAEAEAHLCRIDAEQLDQEVSATLAAAQNDPQARGLCLSRVRELKKELDKVEDLLHWPVLVAKAEEEIRDATRIIGEYGGDASDKEKVNTCIRELRSAIDHHDLRNLQARQSELARLEGAVLYRSKDFLIARLQYLQKEKAKLRDQRQAELLFERGRRAIDAGNADALRGIVIDLGDLLPPAERAALTRLKTTVMK